MADASRPPLTPADAAQRRHPVLWIVAAVVTLAGVALIAHGAVRQLAETFGHTAASTPTHPMPPASSRSASPPASTPTEPSAAPPPPPSPAELAPTPQVPPAAAVEAIAAPASYNTGSATTPAAAQPVVPGEVLPVPTPRPSASRPVAPSPVAGPAYPVARPPAVRPVDRPLVAAPHHVPPPRRRVRREDGVWVDEAEPLDVSGRRAGGDAAAYVDDPSGRAGRAGAWRGDFPVRPSYRDQPMIDRPFPTHPSDRDPRAGYPRSANPY